MIEETVMLIPGLSCFIAFAFGYGLAHIIHAK